MYIVFLFILVLMLFATKQRKLALQLDCIALFIFSALRYNFGNDYISYHEYYDAVHNGSKLLSIDEIGFYYINILFPNYYLMVAVLSAALILVVYKLIVNNLQPEEYAFGMFVFLLDPYMFLMNLSMIRQIIAVLIIMYAFTLAKKKKMLLFILLCLLSATIHKSAIFILPLYFVFKRIDSIITKPKLFIPAIIALLFMGQIIVDPIVQYALKMMNDPNYYYYYQTVETNSIRATILSSIILLYMCLNIWRIDNDRMYYAKLSVFSLLFDVFAFVIPMIGRMGAYFALYKLVSMPAIFVTCYKESKGIDRFFNVIVFPSLITIIYLLRLYSFFTNPMWDAFTNYHTILDLLCKRDLVTRL